MRVRAAEQSVLYCLGLGAKKLNCMVSPTLRSLSARVAGSNTVGQARNHGAGSKPGGAPPIPNLGDLKKDWAARGAAPGGAEGADNGVAPFVDSGP